MGMVTHCGQKHMVEITMTLETQYNKPLMVGILLLDLQKFIVVLMYSLLKQMGMVKHYGQKHMVEIMVTKETQYNKLMTVGILLQVIRV